MPRKSNQPDMSGTPDRPSDHRSPVSAITPGNMMELVAMPGGKLTPAQQNFKELVARIDAAGMQLQEITKLIDAFRPLFAKKLQPLQDERDQLVREMVQFLDHQLMRKKWTMNQRVTMEDIVCTLAERSLDGEHDTGMEAILNRYRPRGDEDEFDDEGTDFAAEFEAMFGSAPGDGADDTRSPEQKLIDAMRESYDADGRGMHPRGKKSTRQKKAQLRAQQQAEQQAVDAGKLLKEIYRKLTSAIHPDREPDASERVRKTALMAEVNKAYESGNLLKLLQLQMQNLKIDSRAAATMADEKLRLINHTLRQQLSELEGEIVQLDVMAREEFRLDYHGALTAPILQRVLNTAAANARADNKILRQELTAIGRSETELKRWLKEQRQIGREDAGLTEAMLMAMMETTPRKRQRRS